jgi:hypothetical protein
MANRWSVVSWYRADSLTVCIQHRHAQSTHIRIPLRPPRLCGKHNRSPGIRIPLCLRVSVVNLPSLFSPSAFAKSYGEQSMAEKIDIEVSKNEAGERLN